MPQSINSVEAKQKPASNGVKKMIAIFSAIIFFIVLDRFFKNLALADYKFNIIGETLRFSYQANFYIAFSLPLAGKLLIFLISLIIVFLIFFAIRYAREGKIDKLAVLATIILGAGSNLFDRIKYGYVVDYLDLKYFTVFNLADAMITAGVALLMIMLYKKNLNCSDRSPNN